MSFDRWSERVQQLLRDEGLACTIMRFGSDRLPGHTRTVITPEQSAQGAELIWRNAGEELRRAVSWKGTALEVWAALHEYSRNKGALSHNDVRSLTQSPTESISNYLTRAYNLQEVTVQHGVKDERRLVKATLRGLRTEFGHLRHLLRNPGATLADVIQLAREVVSSAVPGVIECRVKGALPSDRVGGGSPPWDPELVSGVMWYFTDDSTWSVTDQEHMLMNVEALSIPVQVALSSGAVVMAQSKGTAVLQGWAGGKGTVVTIPNVLLVKDGVWGNRISWEHLQQEGLEIVVDGVGKHVVKQGELCLSVSQWKDMYLCTGLSNNTQAVPPVPTPAFFPVAPNSYWKGGTQHPYWESKLPQHNQVLAGARTSQGGSSSRATAARSPQAGRGQGQSSLSPSSEKRQEAADDSAVKKVPVGKMGDSPDYTGSKRAGIVTMTDSDCFLNPGLLRGVTVAAAQGADQSRTVSDECPGRKAAVHGAVSVMLAEKGEALGDTSSEGEGSDGEWLKGLTCNPGAVTCGNRSEQVDAVVADLWVKEGWGLLPGLPKLIGTVAQASCSRADSAQGCESQVPVGAKRGRSAEPAGVAAQKCHRTLRHVQVAAAVAVDVQEVDEVPAAVQGHRALKHVQVAAAVAAAVQNVDEALAAVQGAAQVAAAEQAVDQEAVAVAAIDVEQAGAQGGAEQVAEDVQGAAAVEVLHEAWEAARPGAEDGGPVFKPTTLRVMACVAAQLGDQLQMSFHLPRKAGWWRRVCCGMEGLGCRQDTADEGLFHYSQDGRRAHFLIHQQGWVSSSSSSSSWTAAGPSAAAAAAGDIVTQVQGLLSQQMLPGAQLGEAPLMGIRVSPLACGGWRLCQEELVLRILRQPPTTTEECDSALQQLEDLAAGTRPDLAYLVQGLEEPWDRVQWRLMEDKLVYLQATPSMGLDYRKEGGNLAVSWHGAGSTWHASWVISSAGGTLSWGCRQHRSRPVDDLVYCCKLGRRLGLSGTTIEGLCHEVGLAACMCEHLRLSHLKGSIFVCGFGENSARHMEMPSQNVRETLQQLGLRPRAPISRGVCDLARSDSFESGVEEEAGDG